MVVVSSPSFGGLFPDHQVAAFTSESDESHIGSLVGIEADPLADMSQNRRSEYATARACARSAIAEVMNNAVHEVDPVGRGDRGSPVWPPSLTGSISHNRGFCVAVAAPRALTPGSDTTIGIDVETIDRLRPELARRIVFGSERSEIGMLEPAEAQRRLALIFATKEAFYKSQFQHTNTWLGFDAITVSGASGTIAVTLGPIASSLLGACRVSANAIEVGPRIAVGVTVGRIVSRP